MWKASERQGNAAKHAERIRKVLQCQSVAGSAGVGVWQAGSAGVAVQAVAELSTLNGRETEIMGNMGCGSALNISGKTPSTGRAAAPALPVERGEHW